MHDIAARKGIEVVGAIEISWAGIVEGGDGRNVDDSAECEIGGEGAIGISWAGIVDGGDGRIVEDSAECEIGGEGVLSTQRKNL